MEFEAVDLDELNNKSKEKIQLQRENLKKAFLKYSKDQAKDLKGLSGSLIQT